MVTVYSEIFQLLKLGIFNEVSFERIAVEILTGFIIVNTKTYWTSDSYQKNIIAMETDGRSTILTLP
jgi:hypothetical protein